MLGGAQEAWLAQGLSASRARWNILTQQTLMAQLNHAHNAVPEDGRFWTDGWDGYPAARRRLIGTLALSGATNPLVLGGDVHTFYATEIRPDFSRPESNQNRVIATEFCCTSVTSNSRPQERTQEYVEHNPHVKYGRSDKRGYMMLEVTPSATNARFMGLDDVRDSQTTVATLEKFQAIDGRTGLTF
jgi:alkaline phosphatase D